MSPHATAAAALLAQAATCDIDDPGRPVLALEALAHASLARAVQPAYVDAEVLDAEVVDPADELARFLTAIDPEALEDAALERVHEHEGPHGLTAAMLAQLVAWARGA